MFEDFVRTENVLGTIFGDRKGILTEEVMERSTTIVSDVYCEMLRKLQGKIKHWEGDSDHLQYSSDLTARNYHLFV